MAARRLHRVAGALGGRDRTLIASSSRLGRVLRAPLRLIPQGAVVRVLSGPLRGAKWIAGSATHGCWVGTYEKDKVARFAESLRPGDVVYDIGANVGYYSLIAARLVAPGGRVLAAEPHPANVDYLNRHLALNGAPDVQVLEAAVSSTESKARFRQGEHRSMGSLADDGELTVDTVTLDGLVFDRGYPPPGIVKIDVEGAEADVLEGATRMLGTSHPTIFLATHGHDVEQACLTTLRAAGYRCVETEPHEWLCSWGDAA